MLEALTTSTLLVAMAEVGDKTQLLAVMLAAKYRRPWPIVLGILVATLLNHALAASVGAWLNTLVAPSTMRWVLGLGFIAMGAWLLVPDQLDDEEASDKNKTTSPTLWAVFATTVVAFFVLEMGDKTQVATVALAARFSDLGAVVLGTTLGMMLANAPVVWLGERLMQRFPVAIVQRLAAGLMVVVGLITLTGALGV